MQHIRPEGDIIEEFDLLAVLQLVEDAADHREAALCDTRNTAFDEAGVLQIGLEEWEISQIRSNLTSKAKPALEEELKAPSRPRLSIHSFFGRFSTAPSAEQATAHKRLSRTSVPLPRPSPTLEEGPDPPADSSGDGLSPATPQARLASMAMQSKPSGVLSMKGDSNAIVVAVPAQRISMHEW